MIKIKQKGDLKDTEKFLNRMLHKDYLNILARYGEEGVQALAANTPAQSGRTADSWEYGIDEGDGVTTLFWTNTNENDGVNIAVILIYGHGTQNGSYVQGIDFVSPVMAPIFERIANESWKEVTR